MKSTIQFQLYPINKCSLTFTKFTFQKTTTFCTNIQNIFKCYKEENLILKTSLPTRVLFEVKSFNLNFITLKSNSFFLSIRLKPTFNKKRTKFICKNIKLCCSKLRSQGFVQDLNVCVIYSFVSGLNITISNPQKQDRLSLSFNKPFSTNCIILWIILVNFCQGDRY